MTRPGIRSVAALSLSAGLIYLVLAMLMGVIPGTVLSATAAGPGVVPLSAAAQRGRDVYVGEGCSYCHTQQVRPLQQDRVWGRPSTRGDYAYATPELLGTERTGPDLTTIGARQPSGVWHLIHLYQPRAVVHASIMPAYPWLFRLREHADASDMAIAVPPAFAPAGKTVVATQQAKDLVAYLLTLKQAPLPQVAP
jgi:cytochrome c oxidase cbb3-type subunit 2